MLTTQEVLGLRVLKNEKSSARLGKICKTVFSPDGKYVVGFIVNRPDLALMIKRDDVFLALDSVNEKDGKFYPTKGKDSFDQRAIDRLGLDWDRCIIWEGMDVKSESGDIIGRVGSMTFNTQSGEVHAMTVNDGASSKAIVGLIEIPASMLLGYQDGYLIVSDEALNIEASGGIAAKAGETFAKATKNLTVAQEKGKQTAKKVDKAAQKSGYALGKQLKQTQGMFSNFKREFEKASKEE